VSAVVSAAAIAFAWVVLRARPDQRSRLKALTPVPTSAASNSASAVARRFVAHWRRRKEYDAVEAATVEAVFALAAELRAGRPPSRALALVAAQSGVLSGPLGGAAAAVANGASASDELRLAADQPGCSGFRSVAAAWDVTSRAGGPVADVLDRLGEVLDADRHARTALAAAMAGSRATMVLLAALPGFGLALGQALGAHPLAMLLHRPLGWMLLSVASVLDVFGVIWTRVIMTRALR
jgi:tight adherence protein B